MTDTGDRGGEDPTPTPCVRWYHYLGLRARLMQGEALDFGVVTAGREVGGH